MTVFLQNHREEIAAVCGRLGVARLDVFGSAVRRDFDPSKASRNNNMSK